MFVQDNSVRSIKKYLQSKLEPQFSLREIKNICNLLLEKRLNVSANELHFIDDNKLSESDLLYFRNCVHRILNNEPIQHIVGSVEFYGLELSIDHRALVPRPETEELVDWVIQDSNNEQQKIVDVCSGSGCIALAIKAKLNHSIVSGWELSEDAIQLATQNAKQLDLDVNFVSQDALHADLDENDYFDIIVSNPPYIPVSEKLQMDKNVTEFDPHMALFVPDEDPLMFYSALGELAMNRLTKGGRLYVEIHENLGKETVDLFLNQGLKNVELRQDLQGKDRMIKAQKG